MRSKAFENGFVCKLNSFNALVDCWFCGRKIDGIVLWCEDAHSCVTEKGFRFHFRCFFLDFHSSSVELCKHRFVNWSNLNGWPVVSILRIATSFMTPWISVSFSTVFFSSREFGRRIAFGRLAVGRHVKIKLCQRSKRWFLSKIGFVFRATFWFSLMQFSFGSDNNFRCDDKK